MGGDPLQRPVGALRTKEDVILALQHEASYPPKELGWEAVMAHVHKIILEYTQLKLDKGKTKAQVGRKLDILERDFVLLREAGAGYCGEAYTLPSIERQVTAIRISLRLGPRGAAAMSVRSDADSVLTYQTGETERPLVGAR